MNDLYISSVNNVKIKEVVTLHAKKGRTKLQKYIIEGEHLIEEAIKSGQELCDVFLLDGTQNKFSIEATEVSSDVMKKIATTNTIPRIVATTKMPSDQTTAFEQAIYLDNISDPGNMGTIIRTAYSFGVRTIIVSDNCCDIYDSKVVRATQGAIFYVEVLNFDERELIDFAKENKYQLYTATLDTATSLDACNVSERFILTVGNESRGVAKYIQENSVKFVIPITGMESLNVGVASGIALYELTKAKMKTQT